MRSRVLRALTATTALVSALVTLLAGGAAHADCQPDPAASGATVTCSGVDSDGFAAGASQNLTVNVLPDASVSTAVSLAVISLNDGNTVVNAGLVAQQGGSSNVAIIVGNTTTVTNLGTILSNGLGIVVAGGGSFSTIINLGTIATSAEAVELFGNSNSFTNSGVVSGFTGAFLSGNGNVVVNNGTITVNQTLGRGIQLQGAGNTAINNGTIAASGSNAFGILASGTGNTIVNVGTITASGPNVRGINIATAGSTATITNLGTIRVTGAGAIALGFQQGTTTSFTNAGLVAADVGGVATGFQTAVSGTGTLTNNGTIDGRMTASGVDVTNNGLIQISTGAVGQAHALGVFTQSAAGTLALRVNAAGANDALGTAGTTVLGGTLRAVVQPGLYGNVTLYPNVVTATAGLGGTQFASAGSTSPFFTASAAYRANAVDLTLTRIPFGALPGLTQNQQAIGNALEAGYSTAATGNAATIYSALLGSTTAPSYDGLSGEVGTGVQNPSFALGDAFLGGIFGQTQRWRSGMSSMSAPGTQSASGTYRVQFAAAQPGFALAESTAQAASPGAGTWPPRSVGPHVAAWASGFGLSGNRDGDGTVGSARLGYSMGGGAFGADVQLAPNLLFGGAVSGAGSDFSLDGRPASGTARTGFFGLYGSWTMGPLYVDAAASYGLASFTTARVATLGTTAENATGSFDGHQVGGRVEAGWRVILQRTELTPFAGVTVQSLHQDGYTETSTNVATATAGILGLTYQPQTTTSVRSTLGAQAATTLQLGARTTISPRIRAAWAHEFNADRQVNAAFLSIPAAAFTVSGARPARDAALVSAGVDVGIGQNVTLYAQFDSELTGAGNAYAGSGGLRLSW
jgi:outer membrane autotransporter protein